jgi:hypothetical protein
VSGQNWREDVLFELRQAVASYHFAHQQMQECEPPDRELSGKPAECSDPRACGKPSAKQCDEALHFGIQPGEAENRKSKRQPADDSESGSGTGTDLRF